MKKLLLAVMIAALLIGCAGVKIEGTQQEVVSVGVELLAFNGGYLIADKWPGQFEKMAVEIAILEAALNGQTDVASANAAFTLAVQKLLQATNNDPLVAANVMFIKSKIKFVSTGDGKPVIDIPQMKAILANFKAGGEARAMIGFVR